MRIAALIGIALMSLPVLVVIVYGAPLMTRGVGLNGLAESIELTLASSLLAAAMDAVLLTPAAYFFSRHPASVADSIADLPASIPHPVIGIAIVLALSPTTPIGAALADLGFRVFDAFPGLSLALMAVSSPIYYRSARNFFESMPRDQEEYAHTMGMDETSTFIRVVLPQSIKGIANSVLVATSRAMSEFGSVAIVAYYVLTGPIRAMPASVMIYNSYSYSGVGAAVSESAVLVLVGLAVELISRLLGWGRQRWW